MNIAIITTSDTRDLTSDEAGHALAALITARGWQVASHEVVPDATTNIKAALLKACGETKADVVLTCGGTGFSPRDVTPEATQLVAQRQAPGIAEAIRAGSMQITPRAMLSRGVSVIRANSLIINLPGSQKAATECFEIIADQLQHAVDMMAGQGHD